MDSIFHNQFIKVFLFQNLLTYRVSKAAGRGRCHRPRWCSRTSWPWHCRRWVPAGRRSHRLWSLGPWCLKRNWESWSCELECWDSRGCRPGLRRTRHKKLQMYEVKTLLSPDRNPVNSNAFLCFLSKYFMIEQYLKVTKDDIVLISVFTTKYWQNDNVFVSLKTLWMH